MSIWGKVIGGAAGFAIGGPLGALMGAAFGHSFDRMKREDAQGAGAGPSAGGRDSLQVLFTTSIVVLGAKLAKADGRVTPDEIAAFKQVFNIPPEDMAAVGRIFDEAKGDAAGFEPYAEQIAAIFRAQPAVLEQLLTALFRIAMADGVYHGAERAYLARVAQIFGFSEAAFARIETMFTQGAAGENPYAVLDLDQNASDSEIKSRYRELIREHHPDRLTAQGMPKEFVAQANDRMAAINAAYDTIEKQRGLK